MSLKILHLVSDEKFIHFIADIFNSCEDVSNTFYVIVTDVTAPLKYISDLPDMCVIDKHVIRSKAIKRDLKEFDAIVVHYLDFLKASLLLMTQSHIPVVWSGWGGDYYCFIGNGEDDLLGSESLSLDKLLKKQRNNSNLLMLIKNSAMDILRPLLSAPRLSKAIRRTDYFSSPVPDDFDLLKSHLGTDFKAEYLQINYASVERTFSPGSADMTGDNILVGNSASLSNNHFEVFRALSTMNLGDRNIVVPLSYGDSAYRDAVIERGHKLFGVKFYPIMDFLPLDQFNSLVASCSVVVMGHRRQQAVGNTATMLYKGAKVFLDESSTVYQFFKKRGAFVYGLKALEEGGEYIFAPLTGEQRQKNRELLEAFWGHDVVLNNVRSVVEVLKSKKRIKEC